jgi:HK97 family phage prohead protease/HK97 family phage major capsid protein
MNKIFNLTSTFKALEQDDDGSVTISGYASTKDFDRAGDSISAEAWTKGGLANFEKNPIILFNHNYDKPIGRAIGLKVTDQGLEMKAKISKSAPDHVAELVKEGILGAFSVGFRVKDADYIKETDGLMIKDAELFEVSVVSVPCNQAATFSLAKSFDSESEYEEFKKTFIDNNSVNLASQSVAEDEVKASNAASDAPDEVEKSTEQETNMSDLNKTNEIDLEAFAKKVAADTAAQIAMKQAEEKALEKAASEKAQAEATQKAEAEAEKKALLADMEAKMAEKQLELEAAQKALEVQLEEKSQEIEKMRDSKKVFADRAEKSNISQWGSEFMKAHILGVMTQKGMNTQFAQNLQEKAGIDYTTNAGDIDQEVSAQIEKEIMRELKVASLFREIQVNGASTILPLQVDTGLADWATNATSGNLENRGATNNTYQPKQVTLTAHRLISTTYMDNEVDELVLVNLLPMLVEGVARAHARSVEAAILNGVSGKIDGLDQHATGTGTLDISDATKLTAAALLDSRQAMGKYGLMPSEIVYIVSHKGYYDLLDDANFQTIDEVGSDLAVRVTGTIGAVFGSPVVVSEEFPAIADGAPAAFAVNVRNFVIPRLRGVTVEQDYEVMNQRRVIVATQSLGFAELVAPAGSDSACVKIDYVA